MTCLHSPIASLDFEETPLQRLRRVVEVHFDPDHGSAYWLDRASRLGIDAVREIHTVHDLARFGDMTPADLCRRPMLDYIPRSFHGCLDRFVVGQTGGTTGDGTWTAYRGDEFCEAFIVPFIAAARHLCFPECAQWLFVGPSGPHIIGKVVTHLANAMGSADPFSVDFDPRWFRRLAPGSVGRNRYLEHIVDQSMSVMDLQDVSVLFTTPPVLEALSERMTTRQRERIEGVHYGGMAISREQLRRLQVEVFPNAVHLSGYGNTLFGCCLELSSQAGRRLDYFPFGSRLLFDVIDSDGRHARHGERGKVRVTRLDESMLIIRLNERDEAEPAAAPIDAPAGFSLSGVRDPQPPATAPASISAGLY